MDDPWWFELLGTILLIVVALLVAGFLGALAARVWMGLWP